VTRKLSAPTLIPHGFPLRLPELLAIRVTILGRIVINWAPYKEEECRLTRKLSAQTLISLGFPLRLPELLAIRVTIACKILPLCDYCWHDPTQIALGHLQFPLGILAGWQLAIAFHRRPPRLYAMRPLDSPAAQERSWPHISALLVVGQLD
jgi:hypothetical protein